MSNVLAFPKRPRPAARPTRGVVYIWPCPDGGGSWSVIYESESGDSSAQLSSWFSFEAAERVARQEAVRLNAELLDGLDENGGAA